MQLVGGRGKMREDRLGQAYHIEKSFATQHGINTYPCGCKKCHGFKTQATHVVRRHHRKYGCDIRLQQPLLVTLI